MEMNALINSGVMGPGSRSHLCNLCGEFVDQVTPCSGKVLLLQKEILEVLDHKGTVEIVRTHSIIMQMGKARLRLGRYRPCSCR